MKAVARTLQLICCLMLVLAVPARTSASVLNPNSWGYDWKMELQEGYCELSLGFRPLSQPFYPDIRLRFLVPVNWRDGRPSYFDRPIGSLGLTLYSYVPNVPATHRPLHRIESANWAGRKFTRLRGLVHDRNDDLYRTFELNVEDSTSVFEALKKLATPGQMELQLNLTNGEEVIKKIPARFFNTWSKMLSVCRKHDASH